MQTHPTNGLKKRRRGHRHVIDYLADANGILAGTAIYPQLFKVMATKQVHDLAITTFVLIFVTSFIWLAYGIHRKALAILITSVMNLFGSGALVYLFFLYRY